MKKELQIASVITSPIVLIQLNNISIISIQDTFHFLFYSILLFISLFYVIILSTVMIDLSKWLYGNIVRFFGTIG